MSDLAEIIDRFKDEFPKICRFFGAELRDMQEGYSNINSISKDLVEGVVKSLEAIRCPPLAMNEMQQSDIITKLYDLEGFMDKPIIPGQRQARKDEITRQASEIYDVYHGMDTRIEVVADMSLPFISENSKLEITIYHGSRDFFEEIDPRKLSNADAVASYGNGFYVATTPDYPREHLKKMGPANAHGIIYEAKLSVDKEAVLEGFQKTPPHIVENILETLKKIDTPDMNPIQRYEIQSLLYIHEDLVEQGIPDDLTGDEYYRKISNVLGQQGASDLLSQSGVDAMSFQQKDKSKFFVVLNTERIGRLNAIEVIGNGPRNAETLKTDPFHSRKISGLGL